MDLKTRKLQFIEEILTITSEKLMDKLESVLQQEQSELDPVLKERLTSRALESNKDIESGRINTRAETEARIRENMGI